MQLLFRDDAYLQSCEARVTGIDDNAIRLDRTVFYPTGGGQPGDSGRLRLADGTEVVITDTLKGLDHDDIVHIAAEGSPLPAVDQMVTAEIDWERRHRLMRMHSCLHLLCAIVEGDVTGGQVGDGKGRLDFNLPDTQLDKQQLNDSINALIDANHEIAFRWISDEDLAGQPELVRTMSVKPPMGSGRVRLIDIDGVDLQPCGGTHVRRTGEIGSVAIGKIENKGRQNRRINIRFA